MQTFVNDFEQSCEYYTETKIRLHMDMEMTLRILGGREVTFARNKRECAILT